MLRTTQPLEHDLISHRLDRAMPMRTLSAILLVLLFTAGCDLGGEYEKKQQATLQSAGKLAVFDQNLHTAFTDVVDTARQPIGVRLRLPRIFDGSSKVTFQDTSKALAQAAIPAPAGVTGSVYTLTRVIDSSDGQKLPCSVALMATPKSGDMKPELMQNMLAKGMSAVFPGAAWSDVTVPTPGGQPLALKRLHIEMSLPTGKATKSENRMDQYFLDAGNHMVIIMWMTPKSQAAQLDPAIEASMGTLEVTAPPGGKAAAPAGKAAPGCF